MDSSFVLAIFFFLIASLFGGIVASLFRIEPFVGYISAGILISSFLPSGFWEIEKLADIGAILLLFSLGVEMSLKRIERIFRVAVFGGVAQMLLSSLVFILFFNLLGFGFWPSLILSLGFSLSSTAVVVKILSQKGETDSIYGQLMIGWLVTQDLAVLPIMILVNSLSLGSSFSVLVLLTSLLKGVFLLTVSVYFARKLVPLLIHQVAALNSRELLLLVSFVFALGTALLANLFGFSAALGAFLAGVVIAETQEKYAVFAETRPLRDLFVALFFVSLGFGVSLQFMYANLARIILLLFLVFLVKFVVFLLVNFSFGYRGRVAFFSSVGLTQVGEFAFVVFAQSLRYGIISRDVFSLGVAVTLLSLFFSSFVFRLRFYLWKKISFYFSKASFLRQFLGEVKVNDNILEEGHLSDHIVVCGYGRVGSWVCKALDLLRIDFLVVDYNERAVREAKAKGFKAIYGDASCPEIVVKAGMDKALCVIIAIPDRQAQEELVTQIQTLSSSVKIFARAHMDEDFHRLGFLRVDKVIQPEFEAALGMVASVLSALGRTKSEINSSLGSLKRQHTILKS